MGIKEATHSDLFFNRSRVRPSYKRNLSSSLDEKDVQLFIAGTMGTNSNIL
jgi:hypothetical protein